VLIMSSWRIRMKFCPSPRPSLGFAFGVLVFKMDGVGVRILVVLVACFVHPLSLA
jgi:hypothetical protein